MSVYILHWRIAHHVISSVYFVKRKYKPFSSVLCFGSDFSQPQAILSEFKGQVRGSRHDSFREAIGLLQISFIMADLRIVRKPVAVTRSQEYALFFQTDPSDIS